MKTTDTYSGQWLKTLRLLGAALLLTTLTACGGGGSDGGGTNDGDDGNGGSTQDSYLEGTAATGAPIKGDINVTGKMGKKATVRINDDGSYRVTITGLTPPYLVEATPDNTAQGSEYAVAYQPNQRVNVTPLSSLALFLATGQTDLQALASGWSSNYDSIDQQGFEQSLQVVMANLASLFSGAGIDPQTFDPLTDDFDADNTGFDAVLDDLDISFSGTGFTLTFNGQEIDFDDTPGNAGSGGSGDDTGNAGNDSDGDGTATGGLGNFGSITLTGSGAAGLGLSSTLQFTGHVRGTDQDVTADIWSTDDQASGYAITLSVGSASDTQGVTLVASTLDVTNTGSWFQNNLNGVSINGNTVTFQNVTLSGGYVVPGSPPNYAESSVTINGTLTMSTGN